MDVTRLSPPLRFEETILRELASCETICSKNLHAIMYREAGAPRDVYSNQECLHSVITVEHGLAERAQGYKYTQVYA